MSSFSPISCNAKVSMETSLATPTNTLAKRRRVLLALYWWEDRIFEGVAKVAAENGWILDCRMRWMRNLPDLSNWQGDGMIANPGFSYPIESLLHLLKHSSAPSVGLQSFGDYPATARVLLDHRSVGSVAAEHLLSLGFDRLGYVAFADNPVENARCAGFLEKAISAGAHPVALHIQDLSHYLSSQSKPIALWAVNDLNAIEVTTRCLDAGLRIPEEVAVLGTDDTRILCDLAEVPLSSVNCNFEQLGEQAARMLQQLMEGSPAPASPVRIQPTGVTHRYSTDTIAIPDLAAIRALRIIRDRFQTQLTIPDIAREVGVSVRHLQQSFQRHLGFTMIHELTRIRVECAKKLLPRTDLKLDAIASECGFSSRFHLIRAFQRTTGSRPTQYRNTLP